MSTKTTRRRSRPVRRQSVPVARRAPGRTAGPRERLVLDRARDLPQARDALLVEVTVGAALTEAALLLSTTPCYPERPEGVTIQLEVPADADRPGLSDPDALRFDGGTEHELWQQIVDAAAAVPSRRGLATLRSLASVLPAPEIAAAASARAEEMASTTRLPEPPWLDALAELECERCWAVDEAGYTIVLGSYRYGAEPHGVNVLVDHAMGGVAKDASTVDVGKVLQLFPALSPVPVARAHQLMAEGYANTYAYRDLPVDSDVHRMRLAVHRRVRLFGG